MLLVAMLVGNGSVTQSRRTIGLGHVVDVVAFNELHAALRHAVVLRAARMGAAAKGLSAGQNLCLFDGIGRSVITQPMRRRDWQLASDMLLNCWQYRGKRSINPVRQDGSCCQEAEVGEQFHGSSAS